MQSEAGFDLKAYLESQSEQGVVDSEGAFTVVKDKALKKFASFALPGSFDWVLKIVQAVNVWKAPKLVIHQTRIATSFYFCPPAGKEFPSDSRIVGALDAAILEETNPVHQLAMALRSLVQQVGLAFVLAVREDGEVSKPIYAGDDVSHLGSRTRDKWAKLDSDGIRLTVSHFKGRESITGRFVPTLTFQSRRDVDILRILEKCCFASPVPIELDGRMVSYPYPGTSPYVEYCLRPLVLGRLDSDAQKVASSQAVSAKLPRQSLNVSADISDTVSPWFYIVGLDWKRQSETYSTATAFVTRSLYSPQPRNCFFWLRHGVVVKAIELLDSRAIDIECSVFFCADDLRSDLSGLQVEVERDTPLVKNACTALVNYLEDFIASSELSHSLIADPRSGIDGGSKSATAQDFQGADAGLFTGSIVPTLPSFGLGMLQVVDRAAEKLLCLPFHDRILIKWKEQVLEQLSQLCLDLKRGNSPRSRRLLTLTDLQGR